MRTSSRDPWARLARWTPARIALGRCGASLPTREVLSFALAHARARDGVHAALDVEAVRRALSALNLESFEVASDALERAAYLRRPDLGRRLSAQSRQALEQRPRPGQTADLALVIGDGLSAAAVQAHAVPLLAAFLPLAHSQTLALSPVVIARGARVALGDEIGALLGARAVAVLIGERPGLSSPDSLGVYLTLGPRAGRSDAERNCISNVRAEGLSYGAAAFKLAWLVGEALRRGVTGVDLKDESDRVLGAGGVRRKWASATVRSRPGGILARARKASLRPHRPSLMQPRLHLLLDLLRDHGRQRADQSVERFLQTFDLLLRGLLLLARPARRGQGQEVRVAFQGLFVEIADQLAGLSFQQLECL